MESLVNDPRFFPKITSPPLSLDPQVTCTTAERSIREVASSLLGQKFPFRETSCNHWCHGGSYTYNTLTRMLPPMSFQTDFFWRKLGKPFASMLDTASFPPEVQCKFLTFIYARVLGMMGPSKAYGSGSIMTLDGSPAELSWVIPREKSTKSKANRQVRFAIEPMDPRSGRPLRGSAVLDYLVSPEGSLGVVSCDKGGMLWRKSTENFLFPGDDESEIPEGSRFFVGFDFTASGILTLKAYYLPSPGPSSSASLSPNISPRSCPINLWDVDYKPLRKLIHQLDPGLMKPLDLLLSYFEDLEERYQPRIQILAMDCVKNEKNRLKIYCRPKEGTSWSDAKRSFTLGGRLSVPHMETALERMEALWNNLFPAATSSVDCDLDMTNVNELEKREENGIKVSETQHPIGGLLYYYSLVSGNETVFPKLYLPVSNYCPNDLFITQAIERFYEHDAVNVEGPEDGESGKGWVTREVTKAYDHRELSERTGIHTYVTFALKENGWDLTSYFSPEVWA